MKNFIKNNLKVFVAIMITTIIVGSVSVYAASQYFAKDITFTPTNENFKKENGEPIENVEDALNELYNQKNNEYTTWLIVEGDVGAKSQLNLLDLKLKKFTALQLICSTSNAAKINISNSNFDQYNTVELNKEYDISNQFYRLFLEKTSGSGWCQVKIKLK